MNKVSKNEKGFSAVEGLLVILILVVIGGVGYMVYHNNHKAKTATTSSTTSKTAGSGTKSATTSKVYTSQDAVTSTEKFYTSFVSYANDTPAPSSSQAPQYYSSIKPDVTTSLYDELLSTTGYNPVTCSQQELSSKVVVDLSSSSAGEASMSVYEYTSSGEPNTSSPIKVTAELNDLKLTSITCPS